MNHKGPGENVEIPRTAGTQRDTIDGFLIFNANVTKFCVNVSRSIATLLLVARSVCSEADFATTQVLRELRDYSRFNRD